MPRFYIPPHAWNPDRLALDDGETHHALGVLRMQAGERATVFNGQGAEATVELAGVEKGRVILKKISAGRSAPLACEIVLGQAIPKGKNMEMIVEKAVVGQALIVRTRKRLYRIENGGSADRAFALVSPAMW